MHSPLPSQEFTSRRILRAWNAVRSLERRVVSGRIWSGILFSFTNCCLLQSARTLSIAWNAGSLLDGFRPESSSLFCQLPLIIIIMGLERWVPSGRIWSGILEFTNCCLLQSPRTLPVAWNAGSFLDGFGPESSSSPIVAYYRPRMLDPLWMNLGLES
jgi:hypothetical protein